MVQDGGASGASKKKKNKNKNKKKQQQTNGDPAAAASGPSQQPPQRLEGLPAENTFQEPVVLTARPTPTDNNGFATNNDTLKGLSAEAAHWMTYNWSAIHEAEAKYQSYLAANRRTFKVCFQALARYKYDQIVILGC